MNNTRYMILDDGETFSGADGSTILIVDVPDEELTDNAFTDLENGDIDTLVEDVNEGVTPGRIIEMSDLLKLREEFLKFKEKWGQSGYEDQHSAGHAFFVEAEKLNLG